MAGIKARVVRPAPKAILTMVVHFDQDTVLPSTDEVREIVDKAREYGRIERADYEILTPVKEDLR